MNNKNHSTDNYVLSISSSTIDSQCQNIANTLKDMGFPASVTANRNVVPNGPDKFKVENGCRISFTNGFTHEGWNKLKDDYKLDCGYLEIMGKFKGCIYDYHQKSNCPKK